jgi:ELWxxDGT repeat protein
MRKILRLIPLVLLICTAGMANAQTPQLFKDLNAGPYPATSNPEGFFTAGNKMYFIAIVGPSRVHQLWVSDGTPANTIMLKDSLIITNLGDVLNVRADMNGTVFFTKEVNGSSTSSTSTQLWITDGTPAGTTLITTLTHTQGSGSGGAVRNFTVVGNKMFFSMAQTNGRELWVTDGTAAGTMEVIDLAPGTVSMQPAAGVVDQSMIAYNGKVYFAGCTTPGNVELFSSDGTAAGTVVVAEVNPNTTISGGSDPDNLIIYNNELYFFADDGTSNSSNGLWKTDGTNTTKVFQNLLTNSKSIVFGNTLYFANAIDLWKTDGTAAGTVMLNDSAAGAFVGANNDYLFTTYTKPLSTAPYYRNYYYKTDGITVTPLPYNVGASASFTVINNKMYISRADSGSYTSFGIWETDGTPAGTNKLTTYGPEIHAFNNALYFPNYDAAHGTELWTFVPAGVTTSVNNPVAADARMIIYPNPSAGIFQLEPGNADHVMFTVYDVAGRKVFDRADMNANESIDLTGLPSGLYVYRVQSTEGISSGKLVIRK